MRSIIEKLGILADWPVSITLDPGLVRLDDPPVIRGDASALRELTGWTPEFDVDRTLADLVRSLEAPESEV